MMQGIPGMLFKQFGWPAVIAVLSSLLVARLLTPMMAAYLLKPQPSRETPDGWHIPRYLASTPWSLGPRRPPLAVATPFLLLSRPPVPLHPPGVIPPPHAGPTTAPPPPP